MPNNGQTM